MNTGTDRSWGWLYASGQTLLVGSIGFVVGVFVKIPSPMPWNLSDANASLLGSFAGSIATLGGAIVLWRMQEHRHARHVMIRINQYILTVSLKLTNLAEYLKSDPEYKDMTEALADITNYLQYAIARLSPYSDKLHMLPDSQASLFYSVEMTLEDLRTEMPTLTTDAAGYIFQAGSSRSREEWIAYLASSSMFLEEIRVDFDS